MVHCCTIRTVVVLIMVLLACNVLVSLISNLTPVDHGNNGQGNFGRQILVWSKTYLQTYLRQIMQDDRDKPSKLSVVNPKYNDQGQPKAILEYFKGKKHGTFIEAGANDGVQESNSLPLELKHGWRGLLIEPAPGLYNRLVRTGRNAMFLKGCLSPKPYPYTATFKVPARIDQGWHTFSHLADKTVADPAFHLDKYQNQSKLKDISVECYPLYDIMVAADLTKVDALMLDVQGPELAILKTLPWENVDIEVENIYVGKNKSQEETAFFNEALAILEPRGYSFLKQVVRDCLFVKNSR